MIKDHTPQELAQAVKIARAKGYKIDISRHQNKARVYIPHQELGNGLGTVEMNISSSSRKFAKVNRLEIKDLRWGFYSYNGKSMGFSVPNKQENIDRLRALGATVAREQGKEGIIAIFEVVREQQP